LQHLRDIFRVFIEIMRQKKKRSKILLRFFFIF